MAENTQIIHMTNIAKLINGITLNAELIYQF